jgi:dipeptidyl aminopeptidase/acylaminoacyl peptidase
MIKKIFQWVGSLLLSGFFLILLLSLISYLKPKEKWGEALSLPTPSPTPSPWENVTLEQIRFGEPKVVLTHTLGFQIVRWISNSEVLILRDTIPGGRGSAIEVFNIETGEVKRLAEGRIWGKPVWSQQAKAIAYLLYDESRKVTSLLWQELDGQPITLLEGAVQPIVLSPGGRGAMACSKATKDLMGKVLPLPGRDIRINFALYAPPAPPSLGCGWKYDTAVSPDGKWQVVYNCEHFLLIDTKGGVIKELDLGTERPGGKGLPRWAMDAQWSPDGKRLAVIATVGLLPNPVRFLILVNPWTNELKEIPFAADEVSWAPNSRFLLTREVVGTVPPGFELPATRLIDVDTLEQREIGLFSERLLGGDISWSPDGALLAFLCRQFKQGRLGHVAICLSSVEVER